MNAATKLTAAAAGRRLSALPGPGLVGPAEPGGLLGGEDEDDVHRCGRCLAEFTSLEEFVQHKIQKLCHRVQDAVTVSSASLLSEEVQKQVVPSLEESVTVAHHILVDPSSLSEEFSNGSDPGQQYSKDEEHSKELNEESSEGQEILQELEAEGTTDLLSVKFVVNEGGRYVCQLCQKTFKTASILKAHMVTHSTRKDYECKLCGTAFRTKGSLIRHNRRHTDERPYKCKKCGKSFRESGALTRHLKSLTPCTDKIRFGISKEIVVSKEVLPAGSSESNTETVTSLMRETIEGSPVISLVTDAKGNVLHEVHVQMHALPLQTKAEAQEMSEAGELQADVELNENLLRQAMKNSGIVIETVTMEDLQKCEHSCVTASEEVENEDVEAEGAKCTEMDPEPIDGKRPKEDEAYICSHCNQAFCGAASLRIHAKGHLGGCLLALKEAEEETLMEEEEQTESVAATLLSEDPHTVLVEFSSVVADTQEYIIEATAEDSESNEAAELLDGSRDEVDSHIMKVVQQIVNRANSGHQILVQNVTVAENAHLTTDATDTITIATPESLTEQVALTLASAIGEGAVLTTEDTLGGEEEATLTVVASEEHTREFVIASQEGEVEVQTVIV
uniref:Transcription factor E4F1 isoform X6 n=1 Tax=Geotrypetes seraphini TaxID=260995 RepID=A0A6P8P4C8_GEOSA|nr:transcription factor E4F1 isoform X6 [Geotrypetes seraphini]